MTLKFRQATNESDSWIKVVRLGDSTAISVFAGCEFFDDVDPETDIVDPVMLRAITGEPAEQLGPAELLYFSGDSHKWHDAGVVYLSKDDPAVAAFVAECDPADVNESSIENVVSDLTAVVDNGQVRAVAGWRVWEPNVAHMTVLTHPDARRKGLGTQVADAATERAVRADLVPQWRAAKWNEGSIALAKSIGYESYGRQLSFRM